MFLAICTIFACFCLFLLDCILFGDMSENERETSGKRAGNERETPETSGKRAGNERETSGKPLYTPILTLLFVFDCFCLIWLVFNDFHTFLLDVVVLACFQRFSQFLLVIVCCRLFLLYLLDLACF